MKESRRKKLKTHTHCIPIDLIVEILARLPLKSIARFHCVSKLWASMLGRPYFKDLFLTRSSTKPRLLFAMPKDGVWTFFSLPQHHNPYEKSSSSSSLVVVPEFHVKFPPGNSRINPCRDRRYRKYFACSYASGLIYFDDNGRPVICNPNTGRYAALPCLSRYRKRYSFLGFDPIGNKFKVLFMGYPFGPDYNRHRILTFGTGEMSWRKIKCSVRHEKVSEGICINGALYYLGYTPNCTSNDELSDFVVVCFDVKSEKFKFVEVESFCKLINYKGKLGLIYWVEGVGDDDLDCDSSEHWEYYVKDVDIDELRVWVLEDVKKQKWSKYVYTLRDDYKFSGRYAKVVGGIATTGEIVLTMCDYTSKQPFYVFYFNPEKDTLQRFEIQGFGDYYHEAIKIRSIYTFVNHIEDLNTNDPKLLKSSINAPCRTYRSVRERRIRKMNRISKKMEK